MTMDRFTENNRPRDANGAFPSTPGAPRETERQHYEEAVRQAMSQAGTTDRSKVVRLLCNSPDEDIRRRARAELDLPAEDDLEEDNGPDPDPRVTMVQRARRLTRERGITFTEALDDVKLQDPALLCSVANSSGSPYEYRLAEVPQSGAWSYTFDEAHSTGSVRENVPVDDALRRRIALAMGLHSDATIADLHRALDRMLHGNMDDQPSVVEPRLPVHGYKGIRKLLAERAHRLAAERQIPYARALSELVAQDPAAYQRALREY